MNLQTTYQDKQRCYNSGRMITPVGILVHSTGANNPNLKRYVYAPALVGTNINKNTWQEANGDVLPHAAIGKDKDGKLMTCQLLEYNKACWGCGSGSKGSYNYAPTGHIQFEICEDGLADQAYFNGAFREAAEYTAYLLKKFNLSVKTVVSHREAAALGYASNHGDPDHWLAKFGKGMDWFRQQVQTELDRLKGMPEAGEKYTVISSIPGYSSAADAKAGANKKTVVSAGIYSIYNISGGMINVTKTAGVPGSWINPADNGAEAAQPEPAPSSPSPASDTVSKTEYEKLEKEFASLTDSLHKSEASRAELTDKLERIKAIAE